MLLGKQLEELELGEVILKPKAEADCKAVVEREVVAHFKSAFSRLLKMEEKQRSDTELMPRECEKEKAEEAPMDTRRGRKILMLRLTVPMM